MKLIEIHKKGINAHNNEVSFYGVDYQTEITKFEKAESVEKAIEIANDLGYSNSENQIMS